MVMVRSITIPRILKRWWNSHDILDIKGGNIQGKEEQCWVARNSRYNTKQEQVCVGGKVVEWSMITLIIEGKDGISHHELNWHPGRAQNADDDHDTIVERFHEDVIGRRWHQATGMMKRKVIEPKGMTQTQNQACCLRQSGMMRKIDVSLAHHRKLCSGNKD
mgnify:CR=1 FL=1